MSPDPLDLEAFGRYDELEDVLRDKKERDRLESANRRQDYLDWKARKKLQQKRKPETKPT